MIKHNFYESIDNDNIDNSKFDEIINKGIACLIKTEQLEKTDFTINRDINTFINHKPARLIEYKIKREQIEIGFLNAFKADDNTFLLVFSH